MAVEFPALLQARQYQFAIAHVSRAVSYCGTHKSAFQVATWEDMNEVFSFLCFFFFSGVSDGTYETMLVLDASQRQDSKS